MDSLILIFLCGYGLYYLNKRQDKVADYMFSQEFDRFERTYHSITYACKDSVVVKKMVQHHTPFAFIPAVNYHARALCLTPENQWFWFEASIEQMKLCKSSITPATPEDAVTALKDDPDILQRYFPDPHSL